MGRAEQAGIDFGDYVSAIDIEEIDRLHPKWIYLVALVMLLVIVSGQLRRRGEGLS